MLLSRAFRHAHAHRSYSYTHALCAYVYAAACSGVKVADRGRVECEVSERLYQINMEPEAQTVNEDPVVLESEADIELGVSKDKRKSYSRETKLAAIQSYHECHNKYKTAKKFGIKPSTLRGWLQNETKIQESSRGSRKVDCGIKAFWPDMEDEFHRQYRELREKGLKIKGWWFEAKLKELMREMHPEEEFKFSDGWFAAFNPLTSKLSPILLCMCKGMSNNEALLSPGPYIADYSIAN